MATIDIENEMSLPLRWDLLDRPLDEKNGLSTRLASAKNSMDLFIAVDGAQRRYLLLQLPSDQTEYISERPSRGLSIRTVEMHLDKTGTVGVFVEIACNDKSGDAALDIIASELLRALSVEKRGRSIAVVRSVMAKWRKFWGEAKSEVLSKQEQIGLFGELWYLAYWLIPALGAELAVSMWRGPVGARNDFESQAWAIEVKTSSKLDGSHSINGLEQLVAFDQVKLMLFSLLIREEMSSTSSLTGMVAIIREAINGDETVLAQFESMLAASGYDDAQREEYYRTKFRVRSECLYKVTDGFPRITPFDLKNGLIPGVGQVGYEIRLDSAGRWLLADSPNDWMKIFSTL